MLNRIGSSGGSALLPRGIVNGLIGAVVVAVWFFVTDSAAGRPFYTPAALGSALFLGAHHAAGVRMAPGIIIGYSLVHVALFSVVGVVLVAAADYLERLPSRVLLVALAAIVLESAMLATLALTAEWVLGGVGLPAIVVGTVLSVAAMVWFAWRTQPSLHDWLRQTAVDI